MKHWLANFSATLVFIDSASEPRSEVLARVAGIGGGGLVFLFAHVVVGAFFAPDRLVEVGVALADIALFPEAADHRGGGLLRFALCRLLSYLSSSKSKLRASQPRHYALSWEDLLG
jgi:hypothetical protein